MYIVVVTPVTFGNGTVFAVICLSVNTITKKLWVNFHEI